MKVIIKAVSNDHHEVDFDPEIISTVDQFKELVQCKTSIEMDRQRLIYRGKVLQDGSALSGYKLEENCVIHMVVRPANFRELQTQATAASPPQSSLEQIHNTNEVTQSESPSEGLNASVEVTASTEPNIEHIRQNLLTINTILSTMHLNGDGSTNSKTFYLGQWLDVKDTVNQWLEATVIEVDRPGNRIFVHYNGWPARWDEWISTDSPRVAPFRSRTNHSALNINLSPNPNILVSHAPCTGPNDVRAMMPEFARVISLLNTVLQEVSDASLESMQRNSPRNVNTASSEYPWDFYLRGHDEPIISESVNDNQDARLKNLFREACPLFDRLGRAMADMSTQMWNYVEPGSVRQNHHNRPIDPMGSFESRIMSLLRERPPSPPPQRAFRAPITAAHRNDGNELLRNPSSLLSFLATNQALSRTVGSDHQVDIQIAILPGSAAALLSGSGPTSSSMTNLTSSLQSQVQQLAQRTQELTDRTNAVTQLSSALRTSMQTRVAQVQGIASNLDQSHLTLDNPSSNESHREKITLPLDCEDYDDFSIGVNGGGMVEVAEMGIDERDSDDSNLEDLTPTNLSLESQTLIPEDHMIETEAPNSRILDSINEGHDFGSSSNALGDFLEEDHSNQKT